jgi:hypothetical protein
LPIKKIMEQNGKTPLSLSQTGHPYLDPSLSPLSNGLSSGGLARRRDEELLRRPSSAGTCGRAPPAALSSGSAPTSSSISGAVTSSSGGAATTSFSGDRRLLPARPPPSPAPSHPFPPWPLLRRIEQSARQHDQPAAARPSSSTAWPDLRPASQLRRCESSGEAFFTLAVP